MPRKPGQRAESHNNGSSLWNHYRNKMDILALCASLGKMNRFWNGFIGFCLGALTGLVVATFFNHGGMRRRDLEKVMISSYQAEKQSLPQVATYMESEFQKAGVSCHVVVDHAIANRTVHSFFIGDSNALFWTYSVARLYHCRFLLLDDGSLLFKAGSPVVP